MPLQDRKQTGDRLKLSDVNYLLANARGAPVQNGFNDNGVTYGSALPIAHGKTIHGKLDGADLPAYALVCFNISSPVVQKDLDREVRITVSRPDDESTLANFIFTNGPYKVKSGTWANFIPVTPWTHTLARVVDAPEGDDPDYRPAVGNPCGIDPATGFVTRRRGGLICIRDGMKVNVAGVPKDLVSVVPCPSWWCNGTTVENDDPLATGDEDTQKVELSAGGATLSLNVQAYLHGTTEPGAGYPVIVSVEPWTGRFQLTYLIGCPVPPEEEEEPPP